jgi:hypothetical protein
MALKSSASAGAYQQMSVTTVVNLTSAPAQATYALISPETNGIRWRDDGTDPTAAVGFPVAAGATFVYDGGSFRRLHEDPDRPSAPARRRRGRTTGRPSR